MKQLAVGEEIEHFICKFKYWKIWILSEGEIRNISEYKYGVFLQNKKWSIASYSNTMLLAVIRVFIKLIKHRGG